MALYQKYRSKRFDEIVAQNHIKNILQSSIKNKSFGHAYLFVGTRGTGKTSLARIFARTINCMNDEFVAKNSEPCNKCESCLQSLEGNSPDILELDAASNRGIDEVRKIIETVDFLPSISKYKIYIVDEVHMMTKEAFNAILKTIEEPPAHVIFIMCTTEVFKVPATIISRSQVFEFKHASISEITEKLERILENENLKISDEGLELVAKLGRGSFRDAESILEKVILNAKDDKNLEKDEVSEILGLSSYLLIENIKTLLYKKDLNNLNTILFKELDEGLITNFNLQLAENIFEDISADLNQNIKDGFKFELLEFLTLLNKDLKSTNSPKILYIARILNFIKNYDSSVEISKPAAREETYIDSKISSTEISDKKIPSHNPSALLRQAKKLQQSEKVEPKSPISSENKKISKLDFLDYIKSKNLFIFRIFSNTPFEIRGGNLFIEPKNKMQRDILSKPQNKELIKNFGMQNGVEMEIIFEKLSEIFEQKKVKDLSDDEVNEIFKV